ncbi:MAG: DUF1844 domain-containing protein [Planctomycetes bacterium]|nr:DUF1844 domain-containing protein [Planctomycetota bacterium]
MSASDADAREARQAGDAPLPGGDFRLLVTKFNVQGLLALGLLENPITGKTEVRLDHARALIDDLRMLREKTRGNLTPEEERALEKSISDLQWQFVERSKGDEPE